MSTANIFVKNWRLLLFILGIIITFWLLYVFRSVLLPFACGLVIAYLLLPVISWLERKLPGQDRWQSTKRVSLIVLVFIVVLLVVGLLAYYIITSVAGSFKLLIQNAPDYFSQGFATFHEWIRNLQQWFPPETQQQIGGTVQNIGTTLGNALQSALIKGLSYIPGTFGMVLGFVSLPIFLFYLLKDSEKLSNDLYSAFSPQVAKHVRGITSIIGRVLGQWIRSELLISVTVAIICLIGLSILGIGLTPALAVFAGMMEFIPILGPWIGGVVGVLVVLAVAPEKAVLAALVYILATLLENTLIRPRIQGAYMRIHPAIVMVLLSLGTFIAGLWGIILVVPLTATIVEIYKYLRQNMVVEGIRPASE